MATPNKDKPAPSGSEKPPPKAKDPKEKPAPKAKDPKEEPAPKAKDPKESAAPKAKDPKKPDDPKEPVEPDDPKEPVEPDDPKEEPAPAAEVLLDKKRYAPKLKPVEFPAFEPAKNHTKILEGRAAGNASKHRDMLHEMSQGDEIRLLAGNNIHLSTQTNPDNRHLGEMAAFVVGKDLKPAPYRAVRFSEVELLVPDENRVDNDSYSYKEFESNLQRQSAGSGSLEVGIPGLFKVGASYSDTAATATYSRNVKIHLQASQLIPKAKVVLNEDDISLDPRFVGKVKAACEAAKPTDKLLALLRDWGHFVPLTMMLGGRMTLHTETELNDKSKFDMTKRVFKVAANAKFSVEGVPVETDGGGAAVTGTKETSSLREQFKNLLVEVKGGDENLVSSKAGEGQKWMATLGRFREWRIVGFYDGSLVPIIDFLPPELKKKCVFLLEDYFLSQLGYVKSGFLGKNHDAEFAMPQFHKRERIIEIRLNHGKNLDGLEVRFEYPGAGEKRLFHPFPGPETPKTLRGVWSSRWGNRIGYWKGEHTEEIIFAEDEELTAIEAGIDAKGEMRRVAFVTNRQRYPSTDFYPNSNYAGSPKTDRVERIEAPRVRSLFGTYGYYINSLGLSHLGLADSAKSREYLLAMEPNLFPTGKYYYIYNPDDGPR